MVWSKFIDVLTSKGYSFDLVAGASDRRSVIVSAGFSDPIEIALLETEWEKKVSSSAPSPSTTSHHSQIQRCAVPEIPLSEEQRQKLFDKAVADAPPFWGVSMNDATAKVISVWHEGPAWTAGIRPGDQIVRIACVDVSNYKKLIARMRERMVNQTTTITVLKENGDRQQYTITPLTNRPEFSAVEEIFYDTKKHYKIPPEDVTLHTTSHHGQIQRCAVPASGPAAAHLGGVGGGGMPCGSYKIPLPEEWRKELIDKAAANAPPFWGVTLNDKTAKVISVWHEGPAWRAGIRPGDQIVRIAGVDVSNYEKSYAQMQKTKVNQTTTITVLKENGDRRQYIMIPLTTRAEFSAVEEIFYDTKKHSKIPS